MRFGEKLRKLRKDSHLTQAELAKRAGLGLKTITNYEKGTTYPQDRRVYGVLAEILGTSADYLHNENDDFISMAGKEFIYRVARRGKADRSVPAGGEMAEEDMDELMLSPFRRPMSTPSGATRNMRRKNISSSLGSGESLAEKP